MTIIHLVTIAIVQGITEFLPVSSSGHLALIPALTDWPDQGLEIDVAAHVGSLGAVLVYFRRDVGGLIVAFARLVQGRPDPSARLLGLLVIATVPTVAVGALIYTFAGGELRQVEVIAWTTLIGAVLLYVADRRGGQALRLDDLRLPAAVLIGFAQVLALVPGTSRAGITMTAARALGFARADAARFSMLMSIPVILAAGAAGGYQVMSAGNSLWTGTALAAVVLSFAAALLTIKLLMSWLTRSGFTPFVIYRLGLAAVLFWLVYA